MTEPSPIYAELASERPGVVPAYDTDDTGATSYDVAQEYVNPDCQVGKHQACSGDAWNVADDELTECTCSCHTADDEHDADSMVVATADVVDVVARAES